jgi:inorganic pyrophosphatase
VSSIEQTTGSQSLRLARAFLGRTVDLVIDRPYGSRHPVHGFRYEANYGYVPGTMAPDGDELDAYYLGEPQPLATARGTCIAIVHRTGDDDDKLVVVPTGRQLGGDEIAAAVEFQEIPGRYRIVWS